MCALSSRGTPAQRRGFDLGDCVSASAQLSAGLPRPPPAPFSRCPLLDQAITIPDLCATVSLFRSGFVNGATSSWICTDTSTYARYKNVCQMEMDRFVSLMEETVLPAISCPVPSCAPSRRTKNVEELGPSPAALSSVQYRCPVMVPRYGIVHSTLLQMDLSGSTPA